MPKWTAHNDARATLLSSLMAELHRTKIAVAQLRLALFAARRLLHPVSEQAAHPDTDAT